MSEIREQILSLANQTSGQIGTFKATSVEGLKRLYYSYKLNIKFGVLPRYLENTEDYEYFGNLCFYLVNTSICLYDFADSVHYLLKNKEESINKLFELTKRFYSINNIPYNPTLYDEHFSFVFSYFLQELFDNALAIYISYIKGKIALLYKVTFMNLTKDLANNSVEYSEIKSFLERIRNRFINFFSINNQDLLLIFEQYQLKESIQKALSVSIIKNIDDLSLIKQNLDSDVYNLYVQKIDEVFSDNSSNPFYIYLQNNNVLSIGNLNNYINYINMELKNL